MSFPVLFKAPKSSQHNQTISLEVALEMNIEKGSKLLFTAYKQGVNQVQDENIYSTKASIVLQYVTCIQLIVPNVHYMRNWSDTQVSAELRNAKN